MPCASQQGLLRQHAFENFFDSNLKMQGFHEVNRISGRAGIVPGTNEIITFGEKDPEATIK